MSDAVDRRPVRELFAAISSDLLLLVSQLSGIAGAEGRVAAGAARNGAMVAVVGAGLVVCGALTLVSALVLAMVALGLSPWAAALAVGVLLTLEVASPSTSASTWFATCACISPRHAARLRREWHG